jgi:hypothetical protein
MAFEPSIAVFDACILYPFHLRNVVVQPAVDRPAGLCCTMSFAAASSFYGQLIFPLSYAL